MVADECLNAQGFLPLTEKLSLLGHGRNGLFRKLMLQKPRVADEGGVEGGGSDIEARKSIEKAKPENIGPEKSPERTKGGLGRQPTGFFL